ncbi:MAG: SRPBCC family protein [Nitrospiraceae bacterium]
MAIRVEVAIDGSKEDVWKVITDIENSPNAITGIEEVEILERPTDGLVGLKWRETRTLFGRTATEIMWITDAKENGRYRTRAESHGAVYVTSLVVSEHDGKTRLTMEFDATPQTLSARVMAATTGIFFKNATKKALMQDLNDIKAVVERSGEVQT